jgi:hypothetical protein
MEVEKVQLIYKWIVPWNRILPRGAIIDKQKE